MKRFIFSALMLCLVSRASISAETQIVGHWVCVTRGVYSLAVDAVGEAEKSGNALVMSGMQISLTRDENRHLRLAIFQIINGKPVSLVFGGQVVFVDDDREFSEVFASFIETKFDTLQSFRLSREPDSWRFALVGTSVTTAAAAAEIAKKMPGAKGDASVRINSGECSKVTSGKSK